MNKSLLTDRIKKIASDTGATLEIEKPKDNTFLDFVLQLNNVDLDITAPKINKEFFAYAISSTGLPRDLYPDSLNNAFAQKRSEEILETACNILTKKLIFHKAPGVFNKKRGYIELPIDGTVRKVYQKKNFFDLPLN